MSLAIALGSPVAAHITLPIYFEDNHAGAFFWIAAQLDLDEPCTLLDFDAHSDATPIFNSDRLRESVRRVSSIEERSALLDEWRTEGVVQSFNWIEPLMPLPFSKVIWVPPERQNQITTHKQLEDEAIEYFDGHLEAASRKSGSFKGLYVVRSLDQLRHELKEDEPLIVTIDLDFFTGMEPKTQEDTFEKVWSFCCVRKNLKAIAFSISRPYLASDEESERLVGLAMKAAASLPTAKIYFEPFLSIGHDASLKASALRKENKPIPSFDVSRSSDELKDILMANRSRIIVSHDAERWQRMLDGWAEESPQIRLAIPGRDPSTDGIWRVPIDVHPSVVLQSEPWDAPKPDSVEWALDLPKYPSCNLTAIGNEIIGFALDSPARPRWQRQVLPTSEGILDLDSLNRFLNKDTGTGDLRLVALAHFGKSIRETPVMEIRRTRGTGFLSSVTEQFGMSYLFGSGELHDGDNTGPEVGWGADCANFLIYAMRRQGLRVPWSNPRQLRSFLEPIVLGATLDSVHITPEDVQNGLIIHLGNHVAAVLEDKGKLGLLDAQDLVVHQLEGFPEVLSLGDLLARRGHTTFDLYRLPRLTSAKSVLFGGDVMLARGVGDRVRHGENPLSHLTERLGQSDLRIVNLESIISDKGEASTSARYAFRAVPQAVDMLSSAGINAVSVANNHAEDFGKEALADCTHKLSESGIIPLGACLDEMRPYSIFQLGGKKVAVLALDALDDATAVDSSGVLNAADREKLGGFILQARAESDELFCFVHWGKENTSRITDEQRLLARWLVNQGVDLIVGAHPHQIQPTDFYHGRPIIYSIGNLVFDGAPSVPGWNEGSLLEVGLAQLGNLKLHPIPVRLDKAGFPRIEASVSSSQ